jgi:Gluconate 2-dehydrogenase subunit 3
MSPNLGYGNDPNVVTPSRPWPLILSAHQRQLISALSDIILPGTAEYPAPSQMGIDTFFDEWVSAPYQTQLADKVTITAGLALVDSEARRQFGAAFLALNPHQQREIVDAIASTSAPDRTFFVRFRYLLVGGYFTSDVGFKAIGYLGNVPLRAYPGVSQAAHRAIDDLLKELGL